MLMKRVWIRGPDKEMSPVYLFKTLGVLEVGHMEININMICS